MSLVKILVDECLLLLFVTELQARGHDVIWARNVCPGVSDEKILQRPNSEGRIVLTEDRDFGKLTMHLRLPALAVVIAHASDFPGSGTDIAKSVANTMEQLDTALIGQLTTIEPGRVRQRPLPTQP